MARLNAVSFHETRSIEAICRTVCAIGFDSLELSRPPFYEKLTTPATRRAFANWANTIGLKCFGFDCWVDVQPFEDPDGTLGEFVRAADFAVDLNLQLVISHDSWASVNGGRSPVEVMRANVALFRQVADLMADRQLTLVLEPHPDTCSMDDSWCVDFIDAISAGHDVGRVGILFDTCHYGVGQPDAYLRALEILGHRIRHIHFSDGDGETYALHLPVGDGCLDLAGVTERLESAGYSGSLTCDMYNYPLLEDGAQRNLERIREVEARLGLLP